MNSKLDLYAMVTPRSKEEVLAMLKEAMAELSNVNDHLDVVLSKPTTSNQMTTKPEMKHPDPKLHLQISIAKSGLRILAGIALASSMFVTSGVLFVLAEVLGIVEELV